MVVDFVTRLVLVTSDLCCLLVFVLCCACELSFVFIVLGVCGFDWIWCFNGDVSLRVFVDLMLFLLNG